MKRDAAFQALVWVPFLVMISSPEPHNSDGYALGQDLFQGNAPPALGLIQTAHGGHDSSFLGLALRRARQDHTVQLLGEPTGVVPKVGYESFEWKGTAWCVALGLEKVTVRYDGPILDRMGLF